MTDWGQRGPDPRPHGDSPHGDPENPAPYFGPPETGPYAPQPEPNPWAQPPYGYGYPPGYPPGYPQPYPPGYPAGSARPGTLTAAAVLGYIGAGLLILAGSLLLFGASFVAGVEDYSGSPKNGSAELAFDGLLNMIAAALLIAGGVMVSGRNATGRTIFSIGGGLVLAESIYWLTRFSGVASSGLVVYTVLFIAITVIALALAWTADVGRWLRRER